MIFRYLSIFFYLFPIGTGLLHTLCPASEHFAWFCTRCILFFNFARDWIVRLCFLFVFFVRTPLNVFYMYFIFWFLFSPSQNLLELAYRGVFWFHFGSFFGAKRPQFQSMYEESADKRATKKRHERTFKNHKNPDPRLLGGDRSKQNRAAHSPFVG